MFPPPKMSLKYKHYPCLMAHQKWHHLQSLPPLSLWEMVCPPSLDLSIYSNYIILCIEFTYIYHTPISKSLKGFFNFVLSLSSVLISILWIKHMCVCVCLCEHECLGSSIIPPFFTIIFHSGISCNWGALKFSQQLPLGKLNQRIH